MGGSVIKISKAAIVVVALASVVACGKKSSPTAPSSTTGQSTQPGPTATGQQTIEGTIDSISAPVIVVGGQSIIVDPSAAIRSGSMPLTFEDLRVGARSRVTAQSDGGALRASAVDMLGDVGSPAKFHGIVTSLERNGDAFEFRLGSRVIRGNAGSQVDGSAGSLAGGATVDVDGLQREEYAYAKHVTVVPADSTSSPSAPAPSPSPSPNSNDTTFNGILGTVSGLCPVISFPINGQVVVTDLSTTYVGGTCSNVVAGESAKVEGTPVGNVLVARQITLK